MVTVRASLMIALASTLATPPLAASMSGKAQGNTPTVERVSHIYETKAVMRDLWLQHVFWVRSVVQASFTDDPAAQSAAEAQVVANARALAAAVRPFYGSTAESKLFTLLAGHYHAVKGYLLATRDSDEARQDQALDDLMTNASAIADFLDGANPYLKKAAVLPMLQAHGGHHIAQIQELQSKDYTAEAETWTHMTQHMYVLADAITDALVRQFPEKF